jgi:hypothetical protein
MGESRLASLHPGPSHRMRAASMCRCRATLERIESRHCRDRRRGHDRDRNRHTRQLGGYERDRESCSTEPEHETRLAALYTRGRAHPDVPPVRGQHLLPCVGKGRGPPSSSSAIVMTIRPSPFPTPTSSRRAQPVSGPTSSRSSKPWPRCRRALPEAYGGRPCTARCPTSTSLGMGQKAVLSSPLRPRWYGLSHATQPTPRLPTAQRHPAG